MAKTTKKAAKKPAKKTAAKISDAKVAAARAKVEAKKAPAKKAPAKKAPAKKAAAKQFPDVEPKKIKVTIPDIKKKDVAAVMGMTPAVHDFAEAFKAMTAPPAKRTAAQLLGDDPKPFNGVTLKELVTVFIADNKRLGELTQAAKESGCDPKAFTIAAVLSLPYMRETKAAVELYLKVLAE